MHYCHGMDTDALRWFQLVADGYTVTEVSEVFGVSQPGVSRALARLEQEVGTPLLRRSGRVLRMTHAGSAFKRHVDSLVNDLDDGLAAVSELVDPEAGVVTLAFPLSLGGWLVPGLIRAFRRDHPRVRIVLQRTAVGESGRVSQLLATRAADVELTAERVTGPGIEWRRILVEPFVLALATTHPLAGRDSVSLAEVADEPFVVRRAPSGMRAQTLALCEAAGFEPAILRVRSRRLERHHERLARRVHDGVGDDEALLVDAVERLEAYADPRLGSRFPPARLCLAHRRQQRVGIGLRVRDAEVEPERRSLAARRRAAGLTGTGKRLAEQRVERRFAGICCALTVHLGARRFGIRAPVAALVDRLQRALQRRLMLIE